jgi:hypothetical protein
MVLVGRLLATAIRDMMYTRWLIATGRRHPDVQKPTTVWEVRDQDLGV